ncbi:MAG TPA: hypothetical protein VG713_11290 [Pirellulales bacterium]|nr:hypothetical protein [Pirellulales bacterium]
MLPSPDKAHDHERTDVHPAAILKFAVGLTIAVILVDAGLRLDFVEMQKHDPVVEEPVTGDPDERVPPAPQLQISDAADLKTFRRAEDDRLSSYGWIDGERQFARIPIAAAMNQVVDHGLPRWPAATGAAAAPEKQESRRPGPALNNPSNRQESERKP